MPKIAVLIQPSLRHDLFPEESLEKLRRMGDVVMFEEDRRPTGEDAKVLLKDAEICVGSWGLPKMDADVIGAAPDLKLIVYAAGSVKAFQTDAVWERGIRVTSGMPAIAVGVAEFTVGLMALGRRDAFRRDAAMHGWIEPSRAPVRELWNSTVGIVSLGMVGRTVIEYLRPFKVKRILAYDPFVSADAVAALGAEKTEMDELLRESDIVSLHAPNLPETRHMIGAEQLQRMKDDALFINTARGAVVKEDDLIEELRKGRLYACLDVTDPEPPLPDSPLRSLPNVFLTPHIAGPRTQRLGILAVEEVERYLQGQPPVCEISREMLKYTS
ncbi:MAG: hydroxyacid dehydrogenase [Armatimonadetes bacterium]|nr:hydroxyacid dehydrogenase [Armatimonadota bacterium]